MHFFLWAPIFFAAFVYPTSSALLDSLLQVETPQKVCRWIHGQVTCVMRYDETWFDAESEDEEDWFEASSSDVERKDDLAASPFTLPRPDTDSYFRRYLADGNYNILCKKFDNWSGYKLSEIQKKAKQLAVKEYSPWNTWTDPHDSWVFLGYRGTDKSWARKAAQKQYEINTKGRKSYGNGIYISPWRSTVLHYGARQRKGRVCYNFAPKSILSQLNVCGLAEKRLLPNSRESPSRIMEPPKEVSMRFDDLHYGESLPENCAIPRQILSHLKVICIEVPSRYQDIPPLFDWNHIRYSNTLSDLKLEVISEQRMHLYENKKTYSKEIDGLFFLTKLQLGTNLTWTHLLLRVPWSHMEAALQ